MVCEVQATAIYGIRVYTRGCVLRSHVDVPETHHISAIINVDQVRRLPSAPACGYQAHKPCHAAVPVSCVTLQVG
jgi:hypothetical protein